MESKDFDKIKTSKILTKIKKILEEENLNENEYAKINEELQTHKKNKEKEIEILKRELEDLKNKSQKYQNYSEENKNIVLTNDLIRIIKEDIITNIKKEIEIKIDQELNTKNINQEYINKKIKDLEIHYQHSIINPELLKLNRKLNKFKNQQSKIINQKEEIDENKNGSKVRVIKKDGKIKEYNIPMNKKDSKNNNKNSPNIFQQNKINEDSIDDKDINNDNKHYINLFNNGSKTSINQKDKSKRNAQDFNNNDQKNAIKIFQDISKLNNINQNKKLNYNLFFIFNDIFFDDNEQRLFKGKKLRKDDINKITDIYFKYKNNNQRDDLVNYFDNYLKTNVFKIFERKKEKESLLDIIKFNINLLLKCFEMNMNKYIKYYYPEYQTNIRDRQKSIDAKNRFRTKFFVGQDVINDEELMKKLDKNDNDENKTFEQMFG